MKFNIKPKTDFAIPLYQIKATYQTINLFDMLLLTKVKINQVLKTKKNMTFFEKIKHILQIILTFLVYLFLKFNVFWLDYTTRKGVNPLFKTLVILAFTLFFYKRESISFFFYLLTIQTAVSATLVPLIFSIPFLRDQALKLLGTDFCIKHISNSIPGYRQVVRIWAPFLFFF